ncbi:hypothetical protein DL89DRAFT_264053 [Linderina pennispora]|uniref:Uncharacterized protein n=1 Tax=Linderina pennispora TaxID=61395 RepID=A0A1Y1WL94_9FUNG|nr:uncharacterized protein DL89DRAFT_264053 [Linderina pennispora]ORX74078.1 hypothetical protein DL89DRAFT_264053 [Linderina pennispora]
MHSSSASTPRRDCRAASTAASAAIQEWLGQMLSMITHAISTWSTCGVSVHENKIKEEWCDPEMGVRTAPSAPATTPLADKMAMRNYYLATSSYITTAAAIMITIRLSVREGSSGIQDRALQTTSPPHPREINQPPAMRANMHNKCRLTQSAENPRHVARCQWKFSHHYFNTQGRKRKANNGQRVNEGHILAPCQKNRAQKIRLKKA